MLCVQAAVFRRKAGAIAVDTAAPQAGPQQIGRLVASIDRSGEMQVIEHSIVCST